MTQKNIINLTAAAYEKSYANVFHGWLHLSLSKRAKSASDRYVFFAICHSFASYIKNQIRVDITKATEEVDLFLEIIDQLADDKCFSSPEWFAGLNELAIGLADINYVVQARHAVSVALNNGARRYPQLYQSLSIQMAYLNNLSGEEHNSADIALRLVRRPYLLPNRKELPAVCYRLMHILSKSMHFYEYRLVIWTGVNSLSASNEQRDSFTSQIIKTYRGPLRAVINGDVSLKFRIPFLFAILARGLSANRSTATVGLDEPFRLVHRVILLLFERFFNRKNELFQKANHAGLAPTKSPLHPHRWNILKRISIRNRILVTRAMGGLGDILMMTPGLRALSKKFPKATIDFAIPKSFHPLLEGFQNVELIDIDENDLNLAAYNRWINLTDCPAARVESRQYPNVRANRIEIFARAMGISKWDLKCRGGFRPQYIVNHQEKESAASLLESLNPDQKPLIALQPFSVDSYKNWLWMRKLALILSKENTVLILHNEHLSGFEGENIHIINKPLRQAAAILNQCNHLVAIDSVFVHLAAALGIPTTAIFGPTSGKVFCRHYDNTQVIKPQKKDFPCSPCWRNEHIACHLTQGRESICMRSISVEYVVNKINSYSTRKRNRNYFSQFHSWVKYGSE